MLEDELLLVAGFENNRVLVKRSDAARQLHSADQIDRNVVPFLSCRVEERILNILLCRLGFHMPISFFCYRCCAMSTGRANWLQLSLVGSYNTALSPAFQLLVQQYLGNAPAAGAPGNALGDVRPERLPDWRMVSFMCPSVLGG